jgi:phage FluMu protein Com
MIKTGYDRYGLSGNPFRDLSSESLENVDIFHVVQEIDHELKIIKDEIFEKENKAVLAILGGYGVGKTERLLLVKNEAKNNGFYSVFKNMSNETRWTVASVMDEMISNANKKLGFFKRIFNSPKWYKNILKIRKQVKTNYDPEKIGHVIVEALNENAPSCLLLNDLHNLSQPADLDNFVQVLHVIADNSDPGVLTMLCSDIDFFEKLMKRHLSMNERINRKFVVPPLSNNEANLMIAKRMLDKRLVDNIEPLYPFTEEAVAVMNDEAEGNARKLLKVASVVIDNASQRKIMTIDGFTTHEILKVSENQKLNVDFEEDVEKKDLSIVETPIKDSSLKKVKKITSSSKVTSVKKSVGNPSSIQNTSGIKSIKVKCPKCAKIFTFEVSSSTEQMRCPNPSCDFVGKINLEKLV